MAPLEFSNWIISRSSEARSSAVSTLAKSFIRPASDGVLDAEVQHRISAIAPMPARHALYLNPLVI
jgi:hypothetical protein